MTTACSFEVMKVRVRDIMHLNDNDTLVLGYKYHRDRRTDEPHSLLTEDHFKKAIETGFWLVKRARTCKIMLELYMQVDFVSPYSHQISDYLIRSLFVPPRKKAINLMLSLLLVKVDRTSLRRNRSTNRR